MMRTITQKVISHGFFLDKNDLLTKLDKIKTLLGGTKAKLDKYKSKLDEDERLYGH